MQVAINLITNLTLGKLRELVNNGELSKFPNSMQINMCIEFCRKNVIDTGEYNYAPILSIIGDDEEINFYNSI